MIDKLLGYGIDKWQKLLVAMDKNNLELDELIYQLEAKEEYGAKVSFLQARLRRIKELADES